MALVKVGRAHCDRRLERHPAVLVGYDVVTAAADLNDIADLEVELLYRNGHLAMVVLLSNAAEPATSVAGDRARRLASMVDRLRAEWLARAGDPRRDSSARRLIEQLPAEPIVSVTRAMEITATSR